MLYSPSETTRPVDGVDLGGNGADPDGSEAALLEIPIDEPIPYQVVDSGE